MRAASWPRGGCACSRSGAADDVTKVLVNPVYAGVGPFPAIVTEAWWIEANAKLMAKVGSRAWLGRMLLELRASFPASRGKKG